MKEKQTYKRFDLLAVLAVLSCAGMFLFEGIFIFERYDLLSVSAGYSVEQAAPSAVAPAVEKPTPVTNESSVPPAEIGSVPASVSAH